MAHLFRRVQVLRRAAATTVIAGAAATLCTSGEEDAAHAWSFTSPKEGSLDADSVGRMLGEGAFAKVKVAVRKRTGEAFAMQLVEKQSTSDEMIQHEVQMLQRYG